MLAGSRLILAGVPLLSRKGKGKGLWGKSGPRTDVKTAQKFFVFFGKHVPAQLLITANRLL